MMAAIGTGKFLTQAEFARHRGVSRKSVTAWKQKGLLVLSEDGRVDVDKTEWNLDQRPAVYRGGVTHRPVRKVTSVREPKVTAKKPAARKVEAPAPSPPAETDAADEIDPNSPTLSLAQAVQRKENYLGLIRRHDFEVANREWVRVEDVGRQVELEYSTVRERLLTIPGKVAAALVGADRATIEAALRREIIEVLSELHDPAAFVGVVAAGGTPANGSADFAAAAGHGPGRMG